MEPIVIAANRISHALDFRGPSVADASAIDERSSLADLGLDSLIAFELKVKIDGELGVELPADRLASDTELVRLAKLLLAQWEERAGSRTTADVRCLRADRVAPGEGEWFRIVPQAARAAAD